MCVVIQPLRTRPDIDIEKWYEESVAERRYALPTDEDERLSLFYQLLERINDGKFQLLDFCFYALGAVHDFDDNFYRMNEQFVRKFARDVGYRLEERLEEIGDDEDVPATAINVFGEGASSIHVAGDVIGAAIGPGATVTARDIVLFSDAVRSLDPPLKDTLIRAREVVEKQNLSPPDKRDLLDELQKLVDALREAEPEATRLRRYWGRIKDIAPPVAQVLSACRSLKELLR